MERNQPQFGSERVHEREFPPTTEAIAGKSPQQQPTEGSQRHSLAESTTEQVKQQTRETVEQAGKTVQEAGRSAAQAAGEATQRFRDESQSFLSKQKDRLADELSHVGAAIREASDKFAEEKDYNVASYVEGVADQIDYTADFLHRTDPNGLIEGAENFARRRPEIFFGGMFLGGIMLARFMKASGRSRRSQRVHQRGGRTEQPASSTGNIPQPEQMAHDEALTARERVFPHEDIPDVTSPQSGSSPTVGGTTPPEHVGRTIPRHSE